MDRPVSSAVLTESLSEKDQEEYSELVHSSASGTVAKVRGYCRIKKGV